VRKIIRQATVSDRSLYSSKRHLIGLRILSAGAAWVRSPMKARRDARVVCARLLPSINLMTSRSKTEPVATRDKTVVTIRWLASFALACKLLLLLLQVVARRDQSQQDGTRWAASGGTPPDTARPSRSDVCVYAFSSIFKQTFSADTQAGSCEYCVV